MYKIVKAMLPFSLFLSGCSSYNEMPEDAGIVPNEEYDRVENILEKASRMYGMIYKDKKHYTKESVTTIEPLEFHDTRGGTCVSPDLYIVNYGFQALKAIIHSERSFQMRLNCTDTI